MLCSYHTTKLDNRDNELDSLAVLRRVYINRNEHKQIASMIQKGEQNLLRIGSLLFLNIGQLLPHQLQAFHTPNCIYPVSIFFGLNGDGSLTTNYILLIISMPERLAATMIGSQEGRGKCK